MSSEPGPSTGPHDVGRDPSAPTAQPSMAELVARHDWATTSLGPAEQWTPPLRMAVGICLSSRFPMMIAWGPELVKIYNDGYREIIGDKHPGALGARASDVWPEVWDSLGPLFDSVMTTGSPTWSVDERLVIDRRGFPEECYFTFSYSPLFDVDGTVGGVLDVAYETTDEVVGRRRLECLADLGASLYPATLTTEVCVRATTALARWRESVVGADLYLRVEGELALASTNRRSRRPPLGAQTTFPEGERRTLVTGRREGLVDGPAVDVIVPLGTAEADGVGLLVVTVNDEHPFDDEYAAFVDVIAHIVGAALDNAQRHHDEVGEYRTISDTLQQAMLQPASDSPTVAARYLPAAERLSVGGDWYDVIDLPDEQRALVVGDCVGHGLEAAATMSQLRSAARSLLLQGLDPARALEGLDDIARAIDGATCATVFCAVIDRPSNRLTYSRAGHLPGLVVSTDGGTWLDAGGGLPLAIEATERSNSEHELADGDLIVLYSDGLVERRGESLDVGLDRLATVAFEHRTTSPHDLADRLIEELVPNGSEDDVVVVVKQLRAE